MPELPEVETTKLGIASGILHQPIEEVIVRCAQLRWKIPVQELQALTSHHFTAVERRAKYLLFYSTKGSLIVHLGMSGSLCILPSSLPLEKHDHVVIVFSNGQALRYRDPRRFGAFLWTNQDPLSHPRLTDLGVEPLTEAFNAEYLWQSTRKRAIPIKILLMDQRVVAGIGNIYANEALFLAKISPQKPADRLTQKECAVLTTAIKHLLAQALSLGGTTLKDFQSPAGEPGYFRMVLDVYGKEGVPCSQCHTPIIKLRVGQRSTFYCQTCQRE